MGSNNNRNSGGNYSVPQRTNLEDLKAGLANYVTNLNVSGVYCVETSDSLMAMAESAINDLGLTQVDRVIIKPSMRRGDMSLEGLSAAVSFDLTGGTDIRSNKVDTNSGNQKDSLQAILWKSSGIKKFGGEFKTSELFRKVMKPLAAEFTDDDDIIIRKPPANYGNNVGIVVVDFMELLRMILKMGSDDPYNFSIINASRIGNEKYQYGILVYIDKGGRRRKGRRNNNIDYQGITDYLFK